MTYNDKELLREARSTPFWKWADVRTMAEDADTVDAREKLKNISSLLFDIYQERGYYDPTEEENMSEMPARKVSMGRRLLQAMSRLFRGSNKA